MKKQYLHCWVAENSKNVFSHLFVSRRVAALLSSFLLFGMLLLPCFVQPAAAYEAQGDSTWYVTGEIEYDGEDCWIIGPNSDGSLYYSTVSTECFFYSSRTVSVIPVPGSGLSSDFVFQSVVINSTLNIPRSGFYVDADWYIHVKCAQGTLEDNINPSVLRVAFIDKAAWPSYFVSSGGVSSTGLSVDNSAMRVFPLFMADVSEWTSLGFSAPLNSDIVISLADENSTVYVPTVGYSRVNSSAYPGSTYVSRRSAADGVSTDIIPIVFGVTTGGYYGKYQDTWITCTLDLTYEYYCPKSKLGDFEIGDKFPRSSELDIDAILDALENPQTEYTHYLEQVGKIQPSDLNNYSAMLDNANSAANDYFDQTVGTVDSETISPWFTDNPFMAVIGMIVCIGFVGMVLKKAVT